MREALAERLLAAVMGWIPEDVARERPQLQAIAAYKYDHYEQFSPGMRFVESLAIWLNRLETKEEREIAYQFVKTRLIFISAPEISHLVSIAYPHYIRPILQREAATLLSIEDYKVTKISDSLEFKLLQRKSLFLGLSDGAHMDAFRRSSNLVNEQVHVDYRIEDELAKELKEDLQKQIQSLIGRSEYENDACFDYVFLLNDFSASSDTLLRQENTEVTGKIAKAMDKIIRLQNMEPPLISRGKAKIFVILYVATETAIENLTKRVVELRSPLWPVCEVKAIYILPDEIKVTNASDPGLYNILPKYYDDRIMDIHLGKGGPNVIYGYAGCSLPVILSHNTPNNSICLLWANKPELKMRALFPRVSRHRGDV